MSRAYHTSRHAMRRWHAAQPVVETPPRTLAEERERVLDLALELERLPKNGMTSLAVDKLCEALHAVNSETSGAAYIRLMVQSAAKAVEECRLLAPRLIPEGSTRRAAHLREAFVDEARAARGGR